MDKARQSVWKSRSVIWGVIWFIAYFGARAAAENQDALSRPVLIAAMLIPVIPAALFLFYFITEMRQMDELQRRIQLEALAFAYPLALLLLMTLGLLEFVIELNPNDWSYRHVWHFLVLFYLFGLAMATRRYQ